VAGHSLSESAARKQLASSVPSAWQQDEYALLQGRQRFIIPAAELDEKELESFLSDCAAGYFPAQVERSREWTTVDVLPRIGKRVTSRPWLNFLLFALTGVTLTLAGADLAGRPVLDDWRNFTYGLPYAISLLTILIIHEAGHYLYARHYRMPVTLPYFIPFYIPFLFHVGTFGAFIRMHGLMINRRALLNIGLWGPVWGFVASLAALVYGYATFPDIETMTTFINTIHPFPPTAEMGASLTLGKNLILIVVEQFFSVNYLPMNEIYHFPLIFAGWVGTLVTALNLLPVGQLDGGHLAYGILQKKAKYVGIFFIGMLIVGSFFNTSWLVWIVLLIVVVRVQHPPSMDDQRPLASRHKLLALAALVIFILSFIPEPLTLR
jgi:membrane-associated protease RseP (regulator of RpoE activity)